MRIVLSLVAFTFACGGRLADDETPIPPNADAGTVADVADASAVAKESGAPTPLDCNHLAQCLDGGCASASPQVPVALVQNQFDVSGLAADGTNVYWAEDKAIGSIDGCAASGCGGNPFAFDSPALNPLAVHSEGPTIYWLEGPQGRIAKCAGGGACATSTTVLTGLWNPWNTFGVGGGRVYFAVMGGPLMSCSDDGCSAYTTIAPVKQLDSVAATESTVFWRTIGDVLACDATTCTTPTTLATQQDGATGIATSACAVYWTSATTKSVMMCPTSGCKDGAITLASSQSILYPGPIAVDDSGVYWATTDGIMQCDAGGCAAPRHIASSVGNATAIALDASNVYFATKGAVWKVAK